MPKLDSKKKEDKGQHDTSTIESQTKIVELDDLVEVSKPTPQPKDTNLTLI